MLPVAWLVVAVVAAIVLTMWVTFTITRLDRLHARTNAASAALDAQLVRRAAALAHVADAPRTRLSATERGVYRDVAAQALDAPAEGPDRVAAENAVGRAVVQLVERSALLDPPGLDELREAATRVLISRRFYNDAVRDTRSLRARRLPRALHLAGHAPLPGFFDIDDTLPAVPVAALPGATLVQAGSPPEPTQERR